MSSTGDYSFFKEHQGLLATLYDPNMSQDKKLAIINKAAGGKDMSKAIEFATSHSNAKTAGLVEGLKKDIQLTASVQSSTASGGAVGSKVIGDLSADTTKVLEAQSAQLLANYNQLIALQKQLNDLQRK
jgi:hypothetical protein